MADDGFISLRDMAVLTDAELLDMIERRFAIRGSRIERPCYKLTIEWPDGRVSTEASTDRFAVQSRVLFLTFPLSQFAIAFRGTTEGLFLDCGCWFRCRRVNLNRHYLPVACKADGSPCLIEGLDADTIISKYWGRPIDYCDTNSPRARQARA